MMEEKHFYTLFELSNIVRGAVDKAFPDYYWVVAEIADVTLNMKGHCYLGLVERNDDNIVAQMRGVIWASVYKKIIPVFEKATGEKLQKGMKILFSAEVSFHEVYGLALNIRDVDPTYTLGEMARKRIEVLERLRKEGIADRNKGLPLPSVLQRIAVISSDGAAGYGDCIHHLETNPHGYRFEHVLFPALMQGDMAESSIVSALNQIALRAAKFDVVAIIRGGGSQVDLSCFDSYGLAAAVARCPIPVISGIGHHRDDTVVDIVSHTKMKTPTAVAEFIICETRAFEEKVEAMRDTLVEHSERLLRDEKHRLEAATRSFNHAAAQAVSRSLSRFAVDIQKLGAAAISYLGRKEAELDTFSSGLKYKPNYLIQDLKNKLVSIDKNLSSYVTRTIMKEDARLKGTEQAIRHLDPANVLRRGYSITFIGGKAIKDPAFLKKNDKIFTKLHKGTLTSTVEHIEEGTNGGE